MRKTLLASASLAVLLTSVSAMAADYTGNVNTGSGTFYIEKNSTINNATFDVALSGSSELDTTRASIGGYNENNTITFSGDNVIQDMLTVEPDATSDTKTTIAADGNATLRVNGYMTVTKNANVDFTPVDLTIGGATKTVADIINEGDGALVLDSDTTPFKVGNITFEEGTRVSLFKADGSKDDANLAISAGKTLTFKGDNKIAPSSGQYAKNQFNVKGEAGSNVDVKGQVDVAINTSIDGSNVNITDAGRFNITDADVAMDFANSNVTMTGAPDGKHNGITSTGGTIGTVNFGENTNVKITEGAGIAVGEVNIGEGSVVTASGSMAVSNPDVAAWRAGSMIQGDKAVNVAQGATVNLIDGGQMLVGFNNAGDNVLTNHGNINLDGGLLRASSNTDGTKYSKIESDGIINVAKDKVGTIASRLTNILSGGVINNGGTLNVVRDMLDIDEVLGGTGALNVAGTLNNSGTINSEDVAINITGDAIATQAEGGKYVSSNGTLNGNLTLTGVDNSATGGAEELAAAPKADFYGANTINGNVTNTLGLITVNKGASLSLDEGKKVTNNGIIDLFGSLNGVVDGAGNLAVQDSAAHVTSFTGNNLEINADTASSKLVTDASTAKQIYVAKGANYTIDNDKITTNDLVVTGTTNLGVDYASAKSKVNDGGVLNLASHNLTSEVHLYGGSTIGLNVDKAASDGVDQAGGQITGDIKTHFWEGETATLSTVVALDAGSGTYKYVSGSADAAEGAESEFKLANGNTLYNVAFADNDKTTLNISKKNSAEVASGVIAAGGNANNAGTVNAWVGGNSDTANLSGASRAMAEHLNTVAQLSPEALVEATTALAPDSAAAIQSTATENANQVFGAVGSRLSGGSVSSSSQGMSSGDGMFNDGAVWVQGLVNTSNLDDTRKSKGFDADSSGIALGAEKYLNDDVKLGLGYAFTKTDIDGYMRKTDVDTHTAIAYGEYKPSNWFVNAIATYGWSDYSEKKNVAGMRVNADYDINTIGLQAMTGYDFNTSVADITPEAGLRYVNIRQDSYRDSVGQKVGENTSDILTGVIGVKAKRDFALENGMNLRPEARFAMTYDMVNDPTNSVVTLANGSGYSVSGDALDRFGIEVGAGITADINKAVELSLGYEGKFRDNYEDHTGLVNAKYKF